MPENRMKNSERTWYNDLYDRLNRKEGEKELYRLARHRDRAGKDVEHVRIIKDEYGNVMVIRKQS